MQAMSQDDKDRFLEFIRSGDDRATAAYKVNADYSGSMFRSMCNPRSLKHYDAAFAAAYEAAVAERGPLDPNRERIRSWEREPKTTNANGFTKAMHLTDEQLEQFVDMVSDGEQAETAARKIEPPTSITQINRRADKDPAFAEAFRVAKEEGYPAFKDRLRAEAVRQAFAGDYRALRDQMIMHLEEARPLTTSRHEIGGFDGGAIRMIAERHFHELPREMLAELIKFVETRELSQQKALPAPS